MKVCYVETIIITDKARSNGVDSLIGKKLTRIYIVYIGYCEVIESSNTEIIH